MGADCRHNHIIYTIILWSLDGVVVAIYTIILWSLDGVVVEYTCSTIILWSLDGDVCGVLVP